MNINLITVDVVFEVISYLGSTFVLISFLLKDVKKIRLINIVGAVFFVIYGIYFKAWAIAILNCILIVVHIYYLVKMQKDSVKI